MSVIALTDVVKRYQTGHETVEALKDVDFRAERGEMVTITGPSGSGKSTLLILSDRSQYEVGRGFAAVSIGDGRSRATDLHVVLSGSINMIGLLDTPTEGHIRLDGRDVTDFTEDELTEERRSKIGFVFQAPA